MPCSNKDHKTRILMLEEIKDDVKTRSNYLINGKTGYLSRVFWFV